MPGASNTLSESNLKKLTVPQLRALCKERRITGYGKIPKDSIIAKLLQWQQTNQPSPPVVDTSPTLTVPQPVLQHTASPVISSEAVGPAVTKSNIIKPLSQHVSDIRQSRHRGPLQESHITATSSKLKTIDASQQPANAESSFQATEVNPLKLPAVTYNTPTNSRIPPNPDIDSNKRLSADSGILQESNKRFKPNAARLQPCIIPENSRVQEASASEHRKQTVSTGGLPKKRFVPLIRMSGFPTNAPVRPASRVKDWTAYAKPSSPEEKDKYLDFEISSFNVPLKGLSYPPSLSQRKRVPQLSLILSEISYRDLKACATVSRSFRYAAFLAATWHLVRHFPGKRTDELLAQYPKDRTDFWPYLLFRQREAESRRRIYEESFLGITLRGTCSIKADLWGSPNHEKQATIAVRFLLTKVYFDISIRGEDEHTLQKSNCGTVLEAEQIVSNQVWKIVYLSKKSVQVYYVLEATCEVIGQAEISGQFAPNTNLRADWFQYIAMKTSTDTGLECTHELWSKISWTNHEEYDRGISKHWLSRIAKEGALGQAKMEVARRYVFACVVSNSVSGSWQSSSEMRQDFNGTRKQGPTAIHKDQKVNLFLPAHHHVESVHFNLGRGRAFHPALAVIQTPSREYYALKDNGMQVGCEEDGIAPIWKQILGLGTQ